VLKGVLWAVYWVKYVEGCAGGCILVEMCVLKVEVHADFSVPFKRVSGCRVSFLGLTRL
jgi:hypothetical protein